MSAHLSNRAIFYLEKIRAPRPTRVRSEGRVYFVEAVGLGCIKVGWTGNVERRLSALRCASPVSLTLLASFPGSPADEQAIHRHFAANRLRKSGEWFAADETLRAFIAELAE
jgi:hypothetical protein